jgi:hypothetical protein
MHRAGFVEESRAPPNHMVAVTGACWGVREQRAEPLLALDQRSRPEILVVEVEKIEQKKDQRRKPKGEMTCLLKWEPGALHP